MVVVPLLVVALPRTARGYHAYQARALLLDDRALMVESYPQVLLASVTELLQQPNRTNGRW